MNQDRFRVKCGRCRGDGVDPYGYGDNKACARCNGEGTQTGIRKERRVHVTLSLVKREIISLVLEEAAATGRSMPDADKAQVEIDTDMGIATVTWND